MATAHALVSLPKTGRGAPPESMTLALDGRCRNVIASSGLRDPEEHTGSLYWVVTRTSDTKLVNLEPENVTWQQQIKVNLPGAKRRKVDPVDWQSSQLPAFMALVSKKATPKHTKLCVFLAEKSKEKKGKQ